MLIDVPEVIETPRLVLHMPKAGFGSRLHEAMTDGYEDYVKWLNWPGSLPPVEMLELECRKHHAAFILRENIRYLIVEKSTQHVVGRCAFPSSQVDWEVPQFGISYFIRQSKRRQGYATEASHALALLAFDILKARKVAIHCDAENSASCSVPEKLGFHLEYTQRGGWPRYDGALVELKAYALFDARLLPHKDIKFFKEASVQSNDVVPVPC